MLCSCETSVFLLITDVIPSMFDLANTAGGLLIHGHHQFSFYLEINVKFIVGSFFLAASFRVNCAMRLIRNKCNHCKTHTFEHIFCAKGEHGKIWLDICTSRPDFGILREPSFTVLIDWLASQQHNQMKAFWGKWYKNHFGPKLHDVYMSSEFCCLMRNIVTTEIYLTDKWELSHFGSFAKECHS